MKTSYASAAVLALCALASNYAAAGGRGGPGPQFPAAEASVSSVLVKTGADSVTGTQRSSEGSASVERGHGNGR